MKTSLALLLSLFAFGCAPKAKPVPYVEPHPRTVEVVDSVGAIRPGIDRASDKVTELKGAARLLAGEAAKARQEADAATAEAKRLANAGAATKAELDGLWKSLTTLSTRNLFLETELNKKEAELEAVRIDLGEARTATAEALVKAGKSEQAQLTLVDTVNGSREETKLLRADLKTEQDAHDTTKGKFSALDGRATIYLWVAGVLAAWQIIKLLVFKRF